jgi:DNA-directed RNA polymerase specialized sigma24 family protein
LPHKTQRAIAGSVQTKAATLSVAALPEQQPLAWVQNVTEDEIHVGDTRALMAKVINSLPGAQRQVIELAFFRV